MSISLAVDRVDYYNVFASTSYTDVVVEPPQYIALEVRDTPRLIFFDPSPSGNSFETVPLQALPSETLKCSISVSFIILFLSLEKNGSLSIFISKLSSEIEVILILPEYK